MKINILLLAGEPCYEINDSDYPLCLTEFDGVTLIERLVNNTQRIKNAHYTFALREDETDRYHIDSVIKIIAPGSQIIRVPKVTGGSACTALMAACKFKSQQEVLIISTNEIVDIDFNEMIEDFRGRNLDGGLLTFTSIHPRYSYVRIDNAGFVTEVAQKNPITNHATTGAFWFARAGDLVEAIKNMIRKDASVDGKFYVAPAFNEIILKQGRVGIREIDTHSYHPLKTDRQIHLFEQEVRTL